MSAACMHFVVREVVFNEKLSNWVSCDLWIHIHVLLLNLILAIVIGEMYCIFVQYCTTGFISAKLFVKSTEKYEKL